MCLGQLTFKVLWEVKPPCLCINYVHHKMPAPTLAETSWRHPRDQFSPCLVGCESDFYPRRAEEAAAWEEAQLKAQPGRACSRGECTICMGEGTCPSHTGRRERYRWIMSHIPTWTGRQKKQNMFLQKRPYLQWINQTTVLHNCGPEQLKDYTHFF